VQSAEEETIMKQLVGRFGILTGVLVAFALLALAPDLGVSGAAAQDGAAVTIVDFAFQPASLEVPAGTTVTWTNSGAATHTVTADNGAFDSGRLASGANFSQTFDTAGTFTYHCEIHPQMTGTIVVTEASGAQPAASGQATQQAQGSNQTQASNQAQANNQAQAPKVAQMPNTGVGTMALAGRNTELVLLTVLAAVVIGVGSLAIRRRA
jgi:plastocyanin